MVQWLRLCASTAGGKGSMPGQGAKIPHAMQRGQKQPQKTKEKKNVEDTSLRKALWRESQLATAGDC